MKHPRNALAIRAPWQSGRPILVCVLLRERTINVTRLLFPVLLALPLAAAAEPVRVTTRLTGQMNPSPLILEQIGLGDFYNHTGGPLPFMLTVHTVFDSEGAGAICQPGRCDDYAADVSYSFGMGGRSVDFSDSDGVARISWSDSSYQNGLSYLIYPYPVVGGNYDISINTWISGPPGSVGDDPLAPQTVGGTGITGVVEFSALPVDPEVPSYWTMGGGDATQVATPAKHAASLK